jgi:uncharacterized protein YndB with AHSA1/START domain
MTTTTGSTTGPEATIQVYRVQIKATPEAVWDAITRPEWTQRYGYESPVEYDLRPGGAYRALPSAAMKGHGAPDVILDGEVIEVDRPRKLVQTWRTLWDAEMMAEGFTRLTWEIEPGEGGLTTLTVTHDLAGAPKTAAQVAGKLADSGGGWADVVDGLKALLEGSTPPRA